MKLHIIYIKQQLQTHSTLNFCSQLIQKFSWWAQRFREEIYTSNCQHLSAKCQPSNIINSVWSYKQVTKQELRKEEAIYVQANKCSSLCSDNTESRKLRFSTIYMKVLKCSRTPVQCRNSFSSSTIWIKNGSRTMQIVDHTDTVAGTWVFKNKLYHAETHEQEWIDKEKICTYARHTTNKLVTRS